jgi:radical SAM superfamily enzyme YgiQ (UPF0313 family)
MKILFIIEQLNLVEPLGLMYLMTVAKENGHDYKLAVNQLEDALSKSLQYKPDIVAVSSMSAEFGGLLALSKEIKKRTNAFVVFGGVHVTFYRDSISEDSIDAICVGEGEGAFLELLQRMEAGKEIRGIRNILTDVKDKLEVRSSEQDLDSFSFPDRETIYNNYKSLKKNGMKSFITSRGCPYPCTYCFNYKFNQIYKGKGKIVRRRSVSNVIDEIKAVKSKYRIDIIRFGDDSFVLRKDAWLEEFARRFKKEVNITFYCLVQPDIITEDIIILLKNAGCYSISMSIEAGNSELRKGTLRRRVSNEQLKLAFDLCHKHGLKTYSAVMVGLPDSTIKHDIESVDFAIECRPNISPFLIFMPFPGTQLGELCIKKGYYDGDLKKVYSNQTISPLSCFTDKEKDIQKNLTYLAPVAIKFPVLRNLIINCLIYWKPNKIFFVIQFLLLGYLWGFVIAPWKYNLLDVFDGVKKALTFWTNIQTEQH